MLNANLFSNLSIRRKLILIVMAASTIALVLASGGFLTYELITGPRDAKERLATLADVIGANTTAAITFEDKDDATAMLSALRANPYISSANIHTTDGELFAYYIAEGEEPKLKDELQGAVNYFASEHPVVTRPIVLDNETIGTISIYSHMMDLQARYHRYLGITALLLVMSVMAAFFVSSILQRVISDPILQLAQTARSISANKDYSVRVEKKREDELGELIDGFNEMLAQIQKRDNALASSEERLARLVETTPNGITIVNKDGQITFANLTAEKAFGISRDEITKRLYNDPAWKITAEDGKPFPDEDLPLRRVMRTGKSVYDIVHAIERPDGTRTILSINSAPLRDADGSIIGMVSSIADITERKRAEEALQASEARYRAVVEYQTELICRFKSDMTLTFVNEAYYRYFGKTREELIGHSFMPFILEEDRELIQKNISSLTPANSTVTHEERVVTPTGEIRWQQWNNRAIFDKQGQLIEYQAVGRDITERRRAEVALQKANRTLKALSGVNQALVHAVDESALLNDVCRLLVEIGGYRMAWIGFAEHDEQKTVRPVAYAGYEEGYFNTVKITWSDTELGQGATGTAIRTGKPNFARNIQTDPRYDPWREEAIKRGYASSIAIPLIVDDRTLGTLNLYTEQPNAFDEEEVHLLTELAWDLAYGIMSLRTREERRQAEAALIESETRYRTITESAVDAIVSADSSGCIISLNKAAAAMFGYMEAELMGKPEAMLMPERHRKAHKEGLERMRRTGKPRVIGNIVELQGLRKDGSEFPLELSLSTWLAKGERFYTAIIRDITERKRIEQERQEVEDHKREFYRRTIMAATESKLVITEREEIEKLVGPLIASWKIAKGGDLREVRRGVAEIAESNGMEENRIYDFVLAVGEATTNAFKHAGGGTASLHKRNSNLIFMVSDQGPGIETLTLPEVALLRGYSTAGSLGMGYKAIISIADMVYLATGPSGTTVAFEMSLHPVERPPAIAALPDTWVERFSK